MPSLKEVARADAPEDIQKVYDAVFGPGVDPVTHPGTATGTPGNWWSVFALVPDCFRHAVQGFQFYRGRNRQISPKLRELCLLYTSPSPRDLSTSRMPSSA